MTTPHLDTVHPSAAADRAGTRTIGVVMNGVTGRMGTNQHLVRSILAIRRDGGLVLPDGTRLVPEPLLLGRDAKRLSALAQQHELERWSTDLDECLANDDFPVYFDAQTTGARTGAVARAIAAGKHVYCEKPLAPTLAQAVDLVRAARRANRKTGVVQDKLFLPGFLKLKELVDSGFFGRILSVRGEFGYWVFEGPSPAAQRPAWNYRSEDGGGIVIDMLCHWRYVLDNLIGPVRAVSALAPTHISERFDENGRYRATADDAAYATLELGDGIVVQINSSWCVRVYRDDLLAFQVDGTEGSAVVGLREVVVQPRDSTPRAVWNPDLDARVDYRAEWPRFPGQPSYPNAFRAQWELFLRHVVCDEPFPWDFVEGAKGIQLAEIALESSRARRWFEVPEIVV
jgi:predicted dehydrogenase